MCVPAGRVVNQTLRRQAAGSAPAAARCGLGLPRPPGFVREHTTRAPVGLERVNPEVVVVRVEIRQPLLDLELRHRAEELPPHSRGGGGLSAQRGRRRGAGQAAGGSGRLGLLPPSWTAGPQPGPRTGRWRRAASGLRGAAGLASTRPPRGWRRRKSRRGRGARGGLAIHAHFLDQEPLGQLDEHGRRDGENAAAQQLLLRRLLHLQRRRVLRERGVHGRVLRRPGAGRGLESQGVRQRQATSGGLRGTSKNRNKTEIKQRLRMWVI